MADLEISYGGNKIVELSESGNKTLKTGGKYCEGDISVAYTKSGSDPVIQPLSVTENGTYTAPEGVDGYSPVTVSILPEINKIAEIIAVNDCVHTEGFYNKYFNPYKSYSDALFAIIDSPEYEEYDGQFAFAKGNQYYFMRTANGTTSKSTAWSFHVLPGEKVIVFGL